jgi:hypothetical protein
MISCCDWLVEVSLEIRLSEVAESLLCLIWIYLYVIKLPVVLVWKWKLNNNAEG